MNNINKIKKGKKKFVPILISLTCILGGLGVATAIPSTAVTQVGASDKVGMCKIGAKKASDTLLASCKEKILKNSKAQVNATADYTLTVKGGLASKTLKKGGTSVFSSNTASTKSGSGTENEVSHTSGKATQKTATHTVSANNALRSSVDASLMNAFEELEFEIHIDPNSNYGGCFSTSKHTIEMRSACVGTFRHEMGHFLDVLKNKASQSGEFASIYKSEKGSYAGTNVAYVTKNAQEYFAQSYRNYAENKSKLKADRPLTYGFVQKQVAGISKEDINQMYSKYSWSW